MLEAKIIGNSWPLAIRAGIAQIYEYWRFRVEAPDLEFVLLVDNEPPEKWLKYLERDRVIGVIRRADGAFEMPKLAKKVIGRRRICHY